MDFDSRERCRLLLSNGASDALGFLHHEVCVS